MIKKFLNQKILPVGTPNWNGRIYPEIEVMKCIDNPSLQFGIIGMDYDSIGMIDISKISHKVSNLRIEDSWLVGDMETVATPNGEILSKFDECDVYFATAGFGDIDADGIITNFKPYAINACFKPANHVIGMEVTFEGYDV